MPTYFCALHSPTGLVPRVLPLLVRLCPSRSLAVGEHRWPWCDLASDGLPACPPGRVKQFHNMRFITSRVNVLYSRLSSHPTLHSSADGRGDNTKGNNADRWDDTGGASGMGGLLNQRPARWVD